MEWPRFGALNAEAADATAEGDATARIDLKKVRALAIDTPCVKTRPDRVENGDLETLKTGRIANT